jgi:hypothetical protein
MQAVGIMTGSQSGWEWGRFWGAAAGGAASGAMGYQLNRAAYKTCFAAGTPLLWEHGSKCIELFQVGDRVWARSEFDPFGPVELKVVEEVFVRTGRILNVHVGGHVVRTTPEHPFYVESNGWTPANELQEGDMLSSHDGQWVAVEEVYDTGEYETVYNLRVADFHTYFVGAEDWGFSVWAHNAYQPDPKDVEAYIAQRKNGAVDWDSINPNLTVRQQSAIRAAARQAGVEIPTPNPDGRPGDSVSKRTGTYIARELEAAGFPAEGITREARFPTPASTTRDNRFADVLAVNPQTKEAAIVQVVRTNDVARSTPASREFPAMNDILASPRYQDLIDQGYTVNAYMVRRGATSLDSGTLRTY